MRIFKSLILLLIILFYSCNDADSPSEPGWDGHWRITMDGVTQDCSIETGSGYLYFCGTKYKGSLTSTHFNGSYEMNNSDMSMVNTLDISRDGDNISGSIHIKATYNGNTETNTGYLSAHRIKD